MRLVQSLPAIVLSALTGALTLSSSSAFAQVYSNNSPISIPASGTATPFPGTITVSGLSTNINSFRVRLKNFSHSFPADVVALVVAPSGQGYQVLNQNGEDVGVNNITLTFASDSAASLPVTLTSGTFAASGGNTTFAAPAGAVPRAASLGALSTGNPNGTWQLFVQDLVGPDGGTIAGGWELEFGDEGEPTTPLDAAAFTYQGRLDGGAASGTIDARFTLWSHPTTDASLNRLSTPVTVSGITITDGVFTTPVSLGRPLPADIQTWLQVEIASPSGSAFVPLTPRQPMTAAPIAQNVVSGGFSEGSLIGPGRVIGASYHDPSNRGVKSRVGYAIDSFGLSEFTGMQTAVTPGTAFCGNGSELGFFTWECNIAPSREVMRINGRGNVGIGTTAPVERLDVRGGIAMGNSGELRATSSQEDLRIVRGSFSSVDAITAGSGFTVAHVNAGIVQVNFTTPFTGRPTITASANSNPLFAMVANVSTTGFRVFTYNIRQEFVSTDIEFIAVGPR